MVLNIDKFIKILSTGEIEEKDFYIFADYRELRAKTTQYTPTEQEMDIICRVTGIPHDWFKDSDFKMIAPGKLSARTDRVTWLALMGREYLIDLSNEKSYLICLN
jgi:hypothetical protein